MHNEIVLRFATLRYAMPTNVIETIRLLLIINKIREKSYNIKNVC